MLLAEDFRPGALRPAVARLVGRGIDPLELREEHAVRAAVTPEIIIHDRSDENRPGQLVFRAPETDGEDVLTVLDRQQQNLAMHLGDGYRVIRGVAGSGKSLVLVHRARLLAESFPHSKILLTCFNVCLAKALAARLADVKNVDVRTIDSLAFQTCRQVGIRVSSDKDAAAWVRQR